MQPDMVYDVLIEALQIAKERSRENALEGTGREVLR